MEKQIFITHVLEQGQACTGPDIEADSWAEAHIQADGLRCYVDGILDSRHTQEPV